MKTILFMRKIACVSMSLVIAISINHESHEHNSATHQRDTTLWHPFRDSPCYALCFSFNKNPIIQRNENSYTLW